MFLLKITIFGDFSVLSVYETSANYILCVVSKYRVVNVNVVTEKHEQSVFHCDSLMSDHSVFLQKHLDSTVS